MGWACLHEDLLFEIAKRLRPGMDLVRLRGVCRSWRSLVPPPDLRSPTIKLPSFPTYTRGKAFELVESAIYCVQPPSTPIPCCLITVEHGHGHGLASQVHLKHPLFHHRLHLDSYKPEASKLNLLRHRVSKVANVYELRRGQRYEFIKRVAVCDEPEDAGFGFTVMAIDHSNQLLITLGNGQRWITLKNRGRHIYVRYDDVVYHRGKFYAVNWRGTISIDSSFVFRRVVPAFPGYFAPNARLVKCLDDLLLLLFHSDSNCQYRYSQACRYPSCQHQYFRVYKLNEEKGIWEAVQSLGDRVVFLSDQCAFCVSAQDLPGCKNNCIYFARRDHAEAALFDMHDSSLQMLPSVGNLFLALRPWFNCSHFLEKHK